MRLLFILVGSAIIFRKAFYGLKDKHKKVDPELRALELENERIRRIIAKQALEIEVKPELSIT